MKQKIGILEVGDEMKKFPDYKTTKWDKRKDVILKGMHYDYEELESLNNDYLNGKINEVKYHLLLSLCFSRIAKNEFIQGKHRECYVCVSKQVDEFALTVQLLQEGKDAPTATKRYIESYLKSIYYGCVALFVSNYDVIPKVTNPDSNLVQMLLHKTVEQAVDDPIDEMINAISLKNSEQFENALIKRIKEIRRFDVDHFLCMDIWSMGLVKEAEKDGLHFYSDYIEVDCRDM